MNSTRLKSITSNLRPEKRYFSRALRAIVGMAPKVGIIAASDRPQGISIFMRVKDEVDWIVPSVGSIMRIADEMVIVDNGSTDGTFEVLQQMAAQHHGKIHLFHQPEYDLCRLSNFALSQTKFRWVFRWDGDMVAHTSGQLDIANLREWLFSLNQSAYYLVHLLHINLVGDLYHQDPEEMVHIEEYIHTFSEKAFFIHPGRFEAVRFPKFYLPLYYYEPVGFHVNVKPASRMLSRYFWEEWLELKGDRRFPSLESYVRLRIKREFETESIEEARHRCLQRLCRSYIRYEPGKFGPYPELLMPYLKSSRYRLTYENGRITGREEE